MPIISMIWRRRPTISARWFLSGSGRGRTSGRMRSAKRAITSASSVSVLAKRPMALAKSRIWRGLTTQSGSPMPARAAATVASKPPVALRTTRATGSFFRRLTRSSSPLPSRETWNASLDGLRWMSRRPLETSIPAKTGRCSSMTLPCKCGLGPERLSGCGTAMMETAPSSVSGFRAPGGRGLASTFSLADLTSAGNADIQGGPSSDTAESREPEGACQALRRQPEDGRQVESADLRFRSADRTQGAQIDGPVSRGRGCRRCFPKAYAVAARRLPLRLAADHPASDALVPSSVSATPWDLPVAAGRRRSLRQTQIQGLSDRLFPYRHRRGSNRARQALPHRRHRPNVEVRLRRDAREGGAPDCRRPPAPPDRRRPLQGPYRPDRQRNPLHHPRQYELSRVGHLEAGEPVWAHAFEYACAQNDIDHRLTKPKHPWTNGQVERMNRTIKDATVKRYFYETHNQLRAHLQNFVDAYNFARRLKTLRGLTPYAFICKAWTSERHRFKISPLQQLPGLNS